MKKSLIFKTLKLLVLTGLLIGLVLLTTTRAFAEGKAVVLVSERSNYFCHMEVNQYAGTLYKFTMLTIDKELFSFNMTTDLKDCMVHYNEEWQKVNNPIIRDQVLQHYRESAIEVRYLENRDIVVYCIENK